MARDVFLTNLIKSLFSQSIERFGSPLMAESFQACFFTTAKFVEHFCKKYQNNRSGNSHTSELANSVNKNGIKRRISD